MWKGHYESLSLDSAGTTRMFGLQGIRNTPDLEAVPEQASKY